MNNDNPYPPGADGNLQNPYPQQQGYAPYSPQMTPEQQAEMQTFKDGENLNLLSVFHFVLAGLNGLGFLLLIGHYFVMTKMFLMMEDVAATVPPASGSSAPAMPAGAMGDMMDIFGIFYLVSGVLILAAVIANIVAGRMLRKRKGRVFCLVVAALNCLNFPLGTVLGVFTFIVLCRNSVVRIYHEVGMKRGLY